LVLDPPPGYNNIRNFAGARVELRFGGIESLSVTIPTIEEYEHIRRIREARETRGSRSNRPENGGFPNGIHSVSDESVAPNALRHAGAVPNVIPEESL